MSYHISNIYEQFYLHCLNIFLASVECLLSGLIIYFDQRLNFLEHNRCLNSLDMGFGRCPYAYTFSQMLFPIVVKYIKGPYF